MSIKKLLFIILSGIMLIFIFIYPFFAIGSFYNNLSNFKSLNGFNYLSITYPQDFKLINWINNNIKGQPIILEANGDSYTEYARISANTGLQTIVGWPVHEWLWRGTYDVVAPRIDDVKSLYTLKDSNKTNMLLKLYNIKYVVISGLEKSKYPNLSEDKFNHLGKVIYNQDGAKLYKINP